jgi:transcriptional regulator with XRE-family HTH domain
VVSEQPRGFGELLRRYRLEAGLTQEELAGRAGLSARAVSDLERQVHRTPYPDTVRRLTHALGLTDDAWVTFRTARAQSGQARASATHGALLNAADAWSRGTTSLPAELTSFIGRERELRELLDLLPATRLLTLVGPGGVGKSRLGRRLAAEILDSFQDGACLVELGALADPSLVYQAVGIALGVRDQPGTPLLHTLVSVLHTRRMLLVLDDCEHLSEACAELAAGLLRGCPQLHILATSRVVLNVAGEVTWQVPALSLPDPH